MLQASDYPKLLFVGDPGASISPAVAELFAARLCNCHLVKLGAGAHYLQEDHADLIGKTLSAWIAGIRAGATQLRLAS